MKLIDGGSLDIYDVKQLLKINSKGKDLNRKELKQKSRMFHLENKLSKFLEASLNEMNKR